MRFNELVNNNQLNELFRPESKQQAGDILAKAGYELIGSGHYADVWAKPGSDSVLKLFRSADVAYLDFIKLAMANSNPHFPKFKGKLIKVNDGFHAIRMEKLGPSKLTEFWVASLKEYARLIGESDGQADPFSPDYEPLDEDDQEWIDDLKVMQKNQPGLFDAIKLIVLELPTHQTDFHAYNFMRRGTTLVITDPVR